MVVSTKAKHTVTYTQEAQDWPKPKFICHGDQTSACHQYPNCDCEVPCCHEVEPQDECSYLTWLNESCGAECYDGPPMAITSAGTPIVVDFNGDCMDWRFVS